ncbi:hypothetical protein [Lentzea flava]|uniref:Uncharacterized protein n=1 Tax=Lentzea flava TaxID=103732 RepID=A0ABQ2UHR4_9PSEU|nr:hypothetical protein [Lentzea flava]MCP2198259.1 hypothetical protein [Lentzea flava]GGU31286.1 hypothetical protein GCM10010178_24510 [Lentzea flava]
MKDWLTDRAREFASLRGTHVESWVGVEWALREDVPGTGPQFHDPSVPFLQLWGLQAVLADGQGVSVGTYQHDTDFGLWIDPWADFRGKLQDERLWTGSTRWRALTELPTGHVDEVTVVVDEGVLAEVLLRIAGRPLLLMAGEASETEEGGLTFLRLDESVLAFTDPAAADLIPWNPPRQRLAQTP